MSDEWGPWIEHDGKGCPCVGMWVQAVHEGGAGRIYHDEGIAGGRGGYSWDWRNFKKPWHDGALITRIIRYRIRKPRGLTILEELLENLPEEVDA